MTKLEEAFQAIQKLPAAEQERMADIILDFAAQADDIRLSDEQLADLEQRMNDESDGEMTLGEFRARVRKLGT
jgi:putative addiction module component (TIGR02574 family)